MKFTDKAIEHLEIEARNLELIVKHELRAKHPIMQVESAEFNLVDALVKDGLSDFINETRTEFVAKIMQTEVKGILGIRLVTFGADNMHIKFVATITL